MQLRPFQKLTITRLSERTNAHVIGIKPEKDGSTTYAIESLRQDFMRHKTGSKITRINSKDIENRTIKIEEHTI